MPVGNLKQHKRLAYDMMYQDWENSPSGKYMWALGTVDLDNEKHNLLGSGANVISTGDGAPIAVAGRSMAIAGSVYADPQGAVLGCDDADFGLSVTVTAKWLLLVRLEVAGVFTFALGSHVQAIVDLNTTSPLDSMIVVDDCLKIKVTDGHLFKFIEQLP